MSSSELKSRDNAVRQNEQLRCDAIVCEEWQRIVKEFNLRPGSVTEKFMGRVINRIRGTV